MGVAGELYIGGAGLARGYLRSGRADGGEVHPAPVREAEWASGSTGRATWGGVGGRGGEVSGRADEQVKVRGYRIELGEVEAALAAHEGVGGCAVAAREDEPGHSVSSHTSWQTRERRRRRLAQRLRERLPDYMLPAAFVFLDRLPLTPNGKIDRRALPAPDWSSSLARPATRRRGRRLRRRWPASGPTCWGWSGSASRDNFFDLGGDSILSIQIVARAASAGLRLTPKQLFQHQTVEALARAGGAEGAGAEGAAAWAEQGEVTGPVALTPIQRRFFEQERARPEHFNQSVMLRLRADVRAAELREAVAALVRHHDALRLRFRRDEDGRWRQFNAAFDGGAEAAGVFHEVDLGAVDEAERRAALEEAAGQAQRSLSLSGGPLLRALLVRRGEGEEPRLLLVIHHLAVDGVSWRILLEDLRSAYGQACGGRPVVLAAKTSSYQQWAALLAEYAAGGRAEAEARYWRGRAWASAGRLPRDREGGRNRRADARQAVVALSREQTGWLLQEAPAAYRTRIQELLLAALAAVLAEWAGGEAVAVELEGHGREEAVGGADVTRTVGWFTSVYPVLLRAGRGAGPGELIKGIKEQLRGVPEGGLAYGAWRYLRAEGGQVVPREAEAEVVFNYLGQLDQVLAAGAGDRRREVRS